MVRVGIVGVGFMGMIHYLAYQQLKGVKVTAISTRDAKKRAGDWRGIKGNFGPPGAVMDLKGIATYEHFQDLLNDPNVDLIDICLPPVGHSSAAIAALRAGKHALVEKPIALETGDAEKMVAAAKKAGKQLMIGHVLPFFGEYAYALKLITDGKYGRLLGGHFKRIISDPLWIKDFFNPHTVGGPVVDLHIHDAHFIRLVCGMPKAVFSTGSQRGEVVEFFTSQFMFDDPSLAVTATSGVINQQGRSFTHGFEIRLEKATLVYDFAVIDDKPTLNVPLTVIPSKGKTFQPPLPAVDAFAAELGAAAKAVKSGQASPILAGELALDALKLCQKQTQSVRTGKIVKVS